MDLILRISDDVINLLRGELLVCGTYLRASELTLPSAWTAASLTSTVSQRKSGTTSLYSPVGNTFPPGDLLSLRSVVRLSGDELQNGHAVSLNKILITSLLIGLHMS